MNYYIDFDNTLYETAKLTQEMLKAIVEKIVELRIISSNDEYKKILEYVKDNFNSTNDNIFSYAERLSKEYEVDSSKVIEAVKNKIDNGRDIVFDDAERFLKKLKEQNHKVILLTYLPKTNQEYQIKKICGSGLATYFDSMIFTTDYKYTLDIDYKNGIFIDDDPRDLNGLFEKNPIKVIRIRKENNKRSKIDLNNEKIEEYSSFDGINI